MSLKDRLAVVPENKSAFEQWVDSLQPDDRAALLDAAGNRAWTNAELIRVIVAEGGRVSKDTIAVWRNRVAG